MAAAPVWTLEQRAHDGTLLYSYQPENLSIRWVLEDGLVSGSFTCELPIPALPSPALVASDHLLAPFVSDFKLVRDGGDGPLTVMAGIVISVSQAALEDEFVSVAGEDWMTYLKRRQWPYDATLSFNTFWPTGFVFRVLTGTGDPTYIARDIAETVRDLSTNYPAAPDMTHPSFSLDYTVDPDPTGVLIGFDISPGDSSSVYDLIRSLSAMERGQGGFEGFFLPDKTLRLLPQIADPPEAVLLLNFHGSSTADVAGFSLFPKGEAVELVGGVPLTVGDHTDSRTAILVSAPQAGAAFAYPFEVGGTGGRPTGCSVVESSVDANANDISSIGGGDWTIDFAYQVSSLAGGTPFVSFYLEKVDADDTHVADILYFEEPFVASGGVTAVSHVEPAVAAVSFAAGERIKLSIAVDSFGGTDVPGTIYVGGSTGGPDDGPGVSILTPAGVAIVPNNVLDVSFTNTGPEATHVVGFGAGTATQQGGVNKHFAANSDVFRRLDSTSDFGDVKDLDQLESLTSQSLSFKAQSVHELSVQFKADVVTADDGDIWGVLDTYGTLAGLYLGLDIDLGWWHIGSGDDALHRMVDVEVQVTDERDEYVTANLNKYYVIAGAAGLDDF